MGIKKAQNLMIPGFKYLLPFAFNLLPLFKILLHPLKEAFFVFAGIWFKVG